MQYLNQRGSTQWTSYQPDSRYCSSPRPSGWSTAGPRDCPATTAPITAATTPALALAITRSAAGGGVDRQRVGQRSHAGRGCAPRPCRRPAACLNQIAHWRRARRSDAGGGDFAIASRKREAEAGDLLQRRLASHIRGSARCTAQRSLFVRNRPSGSILAADVAADAERRVDFRHVNRTHDRVKFWRGPTSNDFVRIRRNTGSACPVSVHFQLRELR
jgi:hypothetical protein